MAAPSKDLMKPFVVALVKIQGVILLLFGVISLTYFHSYYQNLRAPHSTQDASLAAELDFAGCVLRFALYWTGGLVLVARADTIVTKLSGGPSRKDDPPEVG